RRAGEHLIGKGAGIMSYFIVFMAGGLVGFIGAALIGAAARDSYRERLRAGLRHEIIEELLEKDYGTFFSSLHRLKRNSVPFTDH
ncbi:MAG: hypothetical protein WAK96_08250, partial [Desulfobaccales bacterium]